MDKIIGCYVREVNVLCPCVCSDCHRAKGVHRDSTPTPAWCLMWRSRMPARSKRRGGVNEARVGREKNIQTNSYITSLCSLTKAAFVGGPRQMRGRRAKLTHAHACLDSHAVFNEAVQ